MEKDTIWKFAQALKTESVRSLTWIINDSVLSNTPSERTLSVFGSSFEGALFVQPESIPLPDIDEYFEGLMNRTRDETNHGLDEFQNSYVDFIDVSKVMIVSTRNFHWVPVRSQTGLSENIGEYNATPSTNLKRAV